MRDPIYNTKAEKERKKRKARNSRVIRDEMVRLIKEEKGVSLKIKTALMYRPSEHSKYISKEEFDEIKKRSKAKIKSKKRRKSKSIRTISGGSTGLVQQRGKSKYKSKRSIDQRDNAYESPQNAGLYADIIKNLKKIKSDELKKKIRAQTINALKRDVKLLLERKPEFKRTSLYRDVAKFIK